MNLVSSALVNKTPSGYRGAAGAAAIAESQLPPETLLGQRQEAGLELWVEAALSAQCPIEGELMGRQQKDLSVMGFYLLAGDTSSQLL